MRITVGKSGTGGGFEKFCAGETDISDASRPIEDDEEVPVCEKAGVEYGEVQIANDGIAVATNKELAVDCLTTDQLKQIWNKGSKVKSLSEIDPSLPGHRALALRPGHGLRHVRLLHRRDQRRGGRDAARTTRPPRTTTSSSPASPATRAGSATSASPTTRPRPTSSTWSASTAATAASSRRRRRSRTAPTRRSRARCSCIPSAEGDRAARGQGVHGLHRRQRRGHRQGGQDRAADRRAGRRKAKDELAKAESAHLRHRPTWLTTRQPRPRARWGAGPPWSGAPRAGRASRARSSALLFAAAIVSVAHHAGDRLLARSRETIAFFGDVPIGDFLFGTKWTPLLAGDQQSFGVIPLVWGTLYLTGIGLLVAVPIGACSRDLPVGVRAAPGAQGRSSRCSRCSPASRPSSSATSR